MAFLLGLIPKKYLIGGAVLVFLAVAIAGGYFYLTNKNAQLEIKVAQAQLALKQQEIDNLNAMLDLQKRAIDNLKKDAVVQKQLADNFNKTVDAIRQKTFEDLAEISNTDYGKEANSNAPELQKTINDRMKRILDSISDVSRQGLKQ